MFDALSGLGSIASEFRRMEDARKIWEQSIYSVRSAADQFRDFTESNSMAEQVAKHFHDMEKQRDNSMRTMLDPIAEFRKSLSMDLGIQRVLADFARPATASEEFAKIADNASGYKSALRSIQDSVQASLEHAQQTIAATSIANTFDHAMRPFADVQKHWSIPVELTNSVGALKAMHEQIGRLTLPVIDWSSASTLAQLLGPQGIEAQLLALGIGPDGEPTDEALSKAESDGIGISRKALELMTLLSFILAVLVPIYQELSSRESQQQTEKKFDAQSLMLQAQAKQLEALSRLVEKAFVQETKQTDTRFVVLDRVATVRDKPAHGSAVTGKLLPREVVKLVAEQGKWIRIEYYHWLRQEYQTGWTLKKYLTRVPISRDSSRIAD